MPIERKCVTQEEMYNVYGSKASNFKTTVIEASQKILNFEVEVPIFWNATTLKKVMDDTNVMVSIMGDFGFDRCVVFKDEVLTSIGKEYLYVGEEDMLKALQHVKKQLKHTLVTSSEAIEALIKMKLQMCSNEAYAQHLPIPHSGNIFKTKYLSELKRLEATLAEVADDVKTSLAHMRIGW